MKVMVFSAKGYDRESLVPAAERAGHELEFLEDRLGPSTAGLARGCRAVCAFVNDRADHETLEVLADAGVEVLALRCAGFNNVDLPSAKRLGITVVRVPAYSPNAVAEHTIALILALNRHITRAAIRVRDANFSLEGLVGFDLRGKTVGVVGTGKIGALVARLLWHFRCEVLAYDPFVDASLAELGITYVPLDELFARSRIVSLNCPLTPETRHLVNEGSIGKMQPGVMLVNTGRGGLVDTSAVIEGLKSGQIGAVALDVYEEEADLFFEDRSTQVLADDVFARLLTFHNVLVTAHQAFLTAEALEAIADTTMGNLSDIEAGRPCPNVVSI
jgi:D-lactate dehydrogenase